jgi:RIO kinase 1
MSSDDYFLSKKETKRLDRESQHLFQRIGVDRKTADEVFDRSTLLTVEKLISDRIIDYIDFPISTGKEGNIFLARTPKEKPLVLKIYRISTATFKHMSQYLLGDPRFVSIHKSRRDIIYAWTSKEYKNLEILQKLSIPSPKPIKKINNILVMEYIGDTSKPAPLLKDIQMVDPKKIYDKIIQYMKKMYRKAGLIHSDLSPFNILIFDNKPYIIDLAQGVLRDHPRSDDFLRRDIHTIITYFKKFKIDADEHNVYQLITGKSSE